MDLKDVLFQVNDYDSDGDLSSIGIFLHFGDTRVKVADDLKEFKEFGEIIHKMIREIEETYQHT